MLIHNHESELNMKIELDVMPDVEQVGWRWENTAFSSILVIQFSSVEPDIRTLPNPNLRQPYFTVIPEPHKSPNHKCPFPPSQCMLMHDAWFRCNI